MFYAQRSLSRDEKERTQKKNELASVENDINTVGLNIATLEQDITLDRDQEATNQNSIDLLTLVSTLLK